MVHNPSSRNIIELYDGWVPTINHAQQTFDLIWVQQGH